MTEWKHTLDISKPYQEYRDDELTVDELSAKVANIIKQHPLVKEGDDTVLDNMAVEFEALSEYENLDIEDFDDMMDELYDYADTDHYLWVKTQ